MRTISVIGMGLLAAAAALAQEASPGDAKFDTKELSKTIREMALKSAPKEFVVTPAWNLSTPFPPRLRLPNLPRATIQVGDRVELAHGLWKRGRITMPNAERELALEVTDLKALPDSKYRLSITSAAPLIIDYEFQQWINGLMLLGVEGRAKARVKVDLDCEVALSFDFSSLPPGVKIDPKVTSLNVDLLALEVLDPNFANNPARIMGINEDLRGFVQTVLRGAEPTLRDEANKAIAAAIRDGKGTFSANKLLEAAQPK